MMFCVYLTDLKCFFISSIHKNFYPIKEILSDILSQHNIRITTLENVQTASTSINKSVFDLIAASDFIIADISTKNPNIFFELGVAHSLKKNIIIISKQSEIIPFDLLDMKIIFYNEDLREITIFKNTINFIIEKFVNEKQSGLRTVEKSLTLRFNIESENNNIQNISKFTSFEKFIYLSFKNAGFDISKKEFQSDNKIFDFVMIPPPESNLPKNIIWLVEAKNKLLESKDIDYISESLDKRTNIGIIVTAKKISDYIYKKVKQNVVEGIPLILLTQDELEKYNQSAHVLSYIEKKYREFLFLTRYG